MICECGYPVSPMIITKRIDSKEVPTYENYTCPMCKKKYKLKGFKGEISC